MALIPVIVIGDRAFVLSLDVDTTDRVVAVQSDNNTDRPVPVEVTRSGGNQVISVDAAPGTTRQNLPNARRFRYADEVLADWSASVSLRWP